MPASSRPGPQPELLRLRAGLIDSIRCFMRERGILEVDTPVLNRAGVSDPNIENLGTTLHAGGIPHYRYLGTSPEFYMKRLLAMGSGSIYQLCKVFRDDIPGPRHQPEFTMLEWYRTGYDHHRLMSELAELLVCLGLPAVSQAEYATVFQQVLEIDPHQADVNILALNAKKHGLQGDGHSRELLLDFLFSHAVIPRLEPGQPWIIYHYPACQAALARLSDGSDPSAERFEVFYRGMELANGFHELSDAAEQAQRFMKENQRRKELGKEQVTLDQHLLDALERGLPDCAGVAVGVDRLMMAVWGKSDITEVMTFPFDVE